MAAEGRVLKRKRLFCPTDSGKYVDIPVIYQASFHTAAEQYQERLFYFNNGPNSSRKVHTKRVENADNNGDYIDVERVDSFSIKAMQEQAQEYEYLIKNIDPPPKQSDGSNNPAHEAVHYIRYQGNGEGVWAEIEAIDELRLMDAVSQYQEIRLFLKNDPPGTQAGGAFNASLAICDASLELDESGGGSTGIDPPYRYDPFQNIVNIQWGQEISTEGGLWWILKMIAGWPTHGNAGDYKNWSLLGPIQDSTYSVLFPALDGTLIDPVNYYDLSDCLNLRWPAKPWLHDLLPDLTEYEAAGVNADFYTGGFISPNGNGTSWLPFPGWGTEWVKSALICWIGIKLDWDFPYTGYEPGKIRE